MTLKKAEEWVEEANLEEAFIVEECTFDNTMEKAVPILSENDLAKLKIAHELIAQGISIEAISRMLSIPQEELFVGFDS